MAGDVATQNYNDTSGEAVIGKDSFAEMRLHKRFVL